MGALHHHHLTHQHCHHHHHHQQQAFYQPQKGKRLPYFPRPCHGVAPASHPWPFSVALSHRCTSHKKLLQSQRRRSQFPCTAAFAETPPAPSIISGPAFELAEGQSRIFHELPSGLKMEAIVQQNGSSGGSSKPPVVFLHGSYHAAWCWAVHWLPFFAEQGHHCFALSLLGQGESGCPAQQVAGTLQSHARDVAHFIHHNVPVPPILIGHSFGGLIVQQYLAYATNLDPEDTLSLAGKDWEEPYPRIEAAVLACSVPPTGNGKVVQRYLMRRPLASIKVTLSFAAKAFAYNVSLCRETFFSKDMPTSLVQKYQGLLAKSSKAPIFNLRELNSTLPVPRPFVPTVPILVLGAENDFVVDMEGIQETAAFYETDPIILPSIAHDIMLDSAWEDAAEAVCTWIRKAIL